MKSRKTLVALAALLLLSWNATAQSSRAQCHQKTRGNTATTMGSVERSVLLEQLRGSRGNVELTRYGSVARRAVLSHSSHMDRSPFRPKARPSVYHARARGI